MQRRQFIYSGALVALAARYRFTRPFMEKNTDRKLVRPRRLRPGATVALIAPSSPASVEKIEKALSNLAQMGYKVVEGKFLRARNGYLAGSDADRIADLHWAFSDPAIEAVWCVRGGYGAARLLPSLDYHLIAQNPKPLIGYSDITALHLAIHQRTGLVTFHGPVAGAEFPAETLTHLQSVLVNGHSRYTLTGARQDATGAATLADEFVSETLTPGKASGVLTGGNLSLLASLVGTPYLPDFSEKIVFIEDIGEVPYRLDRMLTQLLQTTNLKKAAGIALGVFADCNPKGDSPTFTLREMLRDRLAGLGIPVAYGLPFGHTDLNATIPYGIKAELDADAVTLTFLEKAVGEW
ncbi:MAG: LD-carboxypeptidase [Saprospiraceae bacterium]|nr:LD-carboxypeptidase [Saprospiraceae bacterium]